jgi:hypothetical protein
MLWVMDSILNTIYYSSKSEIYRLLVNSFLQLKTEGDHDGN